MKIRKVYFSVGVGIGKGNRRENFIICKECESGKQVRSVYTMEYKDDALHVLNDETKEVAIVFPSNIAYMIPWGDDGARVKSAPRIISKGIKTASTNTQ